MVDCPQSVAMGRRGGVSGVRIRMYSEGINADRVGQGEGESQASGSSSGRGRGAWWGQGG